jgi:hypothetical protein
MTTRRAFVLAWAILQLALPGIAAFADAVASRTSVHAVAHVEGSTERDCVRVHETDCVFCQFLSAPCAPAAGTGPALARFVAAAAVPPRADAPIRTASRDPGIPRAPPLS